MIEYRALSYLDTFISTSTQCMAQCDNVLHNQTPIINAWSKEVYVFVCAFVCVRTGAYGILKTWTKEDYGCV